MEEQNNEQPQKSQEELKKERLQGILPTIDIVGHKFYVDMNMQTLRPHDDFISEGIRFDDILDHLIDDDTARIPYNPKTRSVQFLPTLKDLTDLPKDWVVVEIPTPWKMDPLGYARKNAIDIESFLKEYPIQQNLKARVVPWIETSIPEIIQENKKNQTVSRKKLNSPRMIANTTRKGRKK